MSSRAKIIIAVGLMLLVGMVVWTIIAGRRSTSRPNSASSGVSGGQASIPSIPSSIPSTPTFRTGAPALDAFVRSFAERYGSFSNHSGFANLKELLPFMVGQLRDESEAQIARQAAASSSYAGTTTKALAIKEQQVGDSAATFLISTQRRESTAQNPNARIYYQDLELTLTKVGQDWKVHRAVWK